MTEHFIPRFGTWASVVGRRMHLFSLESRPSAASSTRAERRAGHISTVEDADLARRNEARPATHP